MQTKNYKKGFTIIEVSIVFLLIFGVTFLVLPKSFNNTKQAKLISKWEQTYSELEYTFSVITAQRDDKFNKTNYDEEKFKEIVRPYLRIKSELKMPYKQYFMTQKEVLLKTKYHFDKFFITSYNEILGLKWINGKCQGKEVCAIMTFDVNGLTQPNVWGKDIFGINIYPDKIEPLGKNQTPEELKLDCSKQGSGVYCSYYYLIGGRFD